MLNDEVVILVAMFNERVVHSLVVPDIADLKEISSDGGWRLSDGRQKSLEED